MIQMLRLAFRNLGRNRRRSFFSALAMGMALALLLMMASFIEGEMGNAIELTIRLQSGHLQVRSATYDEAKTSLKWEDLIENPEQVAAQIASLAPVAAATPRLYASGFVTTRDESAGVRVMGIDPPSEANAPYRDGMLEGAFLSAEDREGVLIGRTLARPAGPGGGRQRQPVGQHLQRRRGRAAVHHPGHLQHGHERVRRPDGPPAAGQGPGLHRRREPRQHGLRPAEGHRPDRGRGRRAPGAGLPGADLAGPERAADPDRSSSPAATWASST